MFGFANLSLSFKYVNKNRLNGMRDFKEGTWMFTENRAPKQRTFEQLTLYFSVSICVEPKTVFYYLGVTQDL